MSPSQMLERIAYLERQLMESFEKRIDAQKEIGKLQTILKGHDLSIVLAEVIELKEQHADTWRDRNDAYWFYRLSQEFGELGSALAGDHKDPPEWELKQIAAICLNWLEKGIEREIDPIDAGILNLDGS